MGWDGNTKRKQNTLLLLHGPRLQNGERIVQSYQDGTQAHEFSSVGFHGSERLQLEKDFIVV